MLQVSAGFLPAIVPIVFAVSVAGPAFGAAALRPESLLAWTAYIQATERRIARQNSARDRFLSTDLEADWALRRHALSTGDILVDRVEFADDSRTVMDVPSAMLHHWRGAVFVPGASLEVVLDALENGQPGQHQEDVLEARVIERGPRVSRVFLRLERRKLMTVVYDTEHIVRVDRYGRTRGTSHSMATKIAEVRNVGTADEYEVPQGQDRGFLWRWNTYWRYEQVLGGVIAECESVSLSRPIPLGLGTLVGGLVRSTAEESMARTLDAFRRRFATAALP